MSPLVLALGVSWSLGACAVGPNYQGPPATAAPPRYKNANLSLAPAAPARPARRPAVPGPARDADPAQKRGDGRWKPAEPRDKEVRGGWWEAFGDPVLNRYEALALVANQDVQVAIQRIAEARAQVRAAGADLYPQLNLTSSTVRERTSDNQPVQKARLIGNAFGGGGAAGGAGGGGNLLLRSQPTSNVFSDLRFTPADLSWELDLFGRVRRNQEAQRATAEQVAANLQNTLLSVAANVAGTYFNLRSLDAEISVLLRTIATRRDSLRISEERLAAGLTGELDVVRARTELAGNEADLFSVRRVRAEQENALATLVGQPASVLRVGYRPLRAHPPRVPAGLPSALLERRPDVAAAERALAAANANVGAAVAAFFPSVRLTSAAGFESADLGSLFTWPSHVWSLGPSLTVPIFEGGRNRANLAVAQARSEAATGLYRGQVLVAFQDVENALADLRNLAGQAAAEDRAVAAARRTLELSQQQNEKGAVTFLDVLDSERTLLIDERLAAQILGLRWQATIQLVKALGGHW